MKLITREVKLLPLFQKWPKHYHEIPQSIFRKCNTHLELAATAFNEFGPCNVYADLALFLFLNRYAILGSISELGIAYEIDPT